jgi:UDP-glucose 4-epimerase
VSSTITSQSGMRTEDERPMIASCGVVSRPAGYRATMRVVVVGASGNVGISLLSALEDEPAVTSVVGVARRPPSRAESSKVAWQAADIVYDDLVPILEGADVVVHLAWEIQPSHDERTMARTNITGSGRLFRAVGNAGVGSLVYASSVGAYSSGPKDPRVDETWPVDGIPGSFYSRHKAAVEHMLDDFERRQPDVRVVRMRPGLIFQRSQASEAIRFFLGRLVPRRLLSPGTIPVLPEIDGLRFQAVHTSDVAQAYRAAIVRDVHGAFNVVAEPELDMRTVAQALDSRTVPVPVNLVRTAIDLTWAARLQPTPRGWLEMGLHAPLMSADRARRQLGWEPLRSATSAVRELFEGLADGAGAATARLAPAT